MATKRKQRPPLKNRAPQADIVDAGEISLTVQGKDGTKTVTLDVLIAKLAFEEVERKHDVYVPGWQATAPFLTDLAAAAVSLGVVGCSGSVAYQLWGKVSEAYADLKKNMPGARR